MEQGTVKSYSQDAGEGTILPDSGAGSVFLHYTQLPDGIKSVAEGQRLEFEVGEGNHGTEARSVRFL